MTPWLSAAVGFALLCYAAAILVGVARILSGPTAQDRLIGVDVASTTAALLIIALSIRYDSAMPLEAALLIALFGYVAVMTMAKFLLRGEIIE